MRKQSLAIFLLTAISLLVSTSTKAQPKITSFSPASGPIGTTVTITGSGFSSVLSENIVYFGAVRGTVTAASSGSLSVTVPVGATYELISVTTNNFSGSSKTPFNVTLSNPGVFTPATFANRIDIPTGSPQKKIKAADFDNDGLADIVFHMAFSNNFSVSRNLTSNNNVSFSTSANFSTAASISDMTIDDIDGDGKKDIILTHYNSNLISIFKNITSGSTISFSAPVNINPSSSYSGSSERWVTTSDLDDDGKPEILFAIQNASMFAILKNITANGTVAFASATEFTTDNIPSKIICNDVNNDGKKDVIVGYNGTPEISVFQNTTNSNISLATKVNFSTGGAAEIAAVTDLDGDGKDDVVVNRGNGATILVFRNTYSGSVISFAPAIEVFSGVYPTSLNISDFNGDNKADVSLTNSNQYNGYTISLLRNISTPGQIAFEARQEYYTLPQQLGNSILSFDVNNDGKLDIMTSNGSINGYTYISVFLSKVNEPYINSFTPYTAPTDSLVTIRGANFTSATSVKFGGTSAASFTIVSDSVIKAKVASGSSGTVAVTTLNGEASLGGFTWGATIVPPVIHNVYPDSGRIGTVVTISGNNFNSVAGNNIVRFGAVNANVISATPNTITVIVPPGTTYEATTVSTNNYIAYSSKPFNITFAGAEPTFPTYILEGPFYYSGNNTPYKFTLDDLDGDGRPDYAAPVHNSNVMVKRNITNAVGNVLFSNAQNFTTSNNPGDVISRDLNNDGKPELIVANLSQGTISVLKNQSNVGNISFSSSIDFNVGINPGGTSVGDLDNDGKPDIVLVNQMQSVNPFTIKVLRNTSSSTSLSFAPPALFQIGSLYNGASQSTAVADLNGDGKPEIIVSHSNAPSGLSILKNTSLPGVISFEQAIVVASGANPREITIGDIDGDQKPDIVIVNSYNNYSISVLRNISDYQTGTIAFAPKVDYPISWQAMGIAIGDIDGDGKPDIAVAQTYSPTAVAILKNVSTLGVVDFQPKLDFSISSQGQRILLVDLDGDGKCEVAVSDLFLRNRSGEPLPLPISLVNLTAHLQEGRKVQLDWKTANEQNADRFDVEHCTDGINFLKIGAVNALNSPDGAGYNFLHHSPADGINYYRLKMVDKDGKFSYSNVVRVNISNSPHFAVYPTITNDLVTTEHPASDKGKIQVIDVSGKILRSVSLEKNALLSQVSLKGLQSGTYFLVWTDGKITISSKVIVQ